MLAKVYVSRNANDEAARTVVPRSGGLHLLRRAQGGLSDLDEHLAVATG